MKKGIITGLLLMAAILHIMAQKLSNVQQPEVLRNRDRREIRIPNVLGYHVMKCDFHIHTVFSDGSVWPTVRVEEAWSEGLDAISITEHLEYSPKSEYVSTDKNAPYEIAKPIADRTGIILIRGGEITRSMPPGHLNALFISDANALNKPDSLSGIREAKKQGAFIQWNHPGWKAQQPDSCLWMSMHEMLYREKMMHGIEVFNEKEWYPISLDWCLQKGLAPIATSDIHGVSEYFYDLTHAPRPMTLVLTSERTEASIKEALFAARTIAMFNNQLAGKKEYVEALFKASVLVGKLGIDDKEGRTRFTLTNQSDIPYILTGDVNATLQPNQMVTVYLSKGEHTVTVENIWTGATQKLTTTIRFN